MVQKNQCVIHKFYGFLIYFFLEESIFLSFILFKLIFNLFIIMHWLDRESDPKVLGRKKQII